jgi:hypothetical protein
MLVGFKETRACKPVPVTEASAFTVPKIFRLAVLLPSADGVKVRFNVQEELAAMVPPFAQLPVPALAKSPALVPVIMK